MNDKTCQNCGGDPSIAKGSEAIGTKGCVCGAVILSQVAVDLLVQTGQCVVVSNMPIRLPHQTPRLVFIGAAGRSGEGFALHLRLMWACIRSTHSTPDHSWHLATCAAPLPFVSCRGALASSQPLPGYPAGREEVGTP